MINLGKMTKESKKELYESTRNHGISMGYNEEEIQSMLLKYFSEEEISDLKGESKYKDLINDYISLLDMTILEEKYQDNLFMSDFNEKMTKSRFDIISAMADHIIANKSDGPLSKHISDSDMELLRKYVQFDENKDEYEEFLSLCDRVDATQNKGKRLRKFARGKRR